MKVGVPLVEVVRSGFVEGLHTGHVVLLDACGRRLLTRGDVDQPVFPRSANKPMQAVGLLRAGLDLPAAELAVATASHAGEDEHLAVVRRILARAGLTEDDLQCPPDLPLGEAARDAWLAAGRPRARIAMNCSGKHAAMLLTCRTNGWPTRSYREPAHPLQRALHDTIEDLAGERIAATGVDGCGAPLFAYSLAGVSRAYARLATASSGHERAVAEAMRTHPRLIAGAGSGPTLLMAGIPGLIAKNGAEGVYAAALPDGRTVAVKIDDGAARAAERVVVAGLRALGADAPVLDRLAETPLTGAGARVGSVRALAFSA